MKSDLDEQLDGALANAFSHLDWLKVEILCYQLVDENLMRLLRNL